MTSDEAVNVGALVEMSRGECLSLLGRFGIGRVASCAPGSSPHVVPVNYVLDGEDIVFRSDPGLKLELVLAHPCSFEVDDVDVVHRTGWSVLVQGDAREATPDEIGAIASQPSPWAAGEKRHLVRLVARSITGRRIALPDIVLDGRGYL